jgi:hypothetical protein
MYTKNKQLKVTRKQDGKELFFPSVKAASEALDISIAVIRTSLKKPFHYSHQADYPRDKFGRILVGAKYCPFDFEYVYPDPMITLYPDSEELSSQSCYSMTQAANFLHIPKQRLYLLKKDAVVGEPCDKPITDPVTDVTWLVVFNSLESVQLSGISNWKNNRAEE